MNEPLGDSSVAPARSRILIADDHALLREGLRALISSTSDMEVVGEAGDVREALWEAERLAPDLVLMDLNMGGGSALQAIRTMAERRPGVRILVLTMHEDPSFLRSALAAGAAGYVLKRSAYSALLDALRAVRAGRMFVDPGVALESQEPTESNRNGGRPPSLSRREHEVLVLLARGLTYRQVGERLHMAERTVESHRRRIGEKLGLRTRADLLRYCLELGLLRPGDLDSEQA